MHSASRGCGSVCAAARSGAFQRRNLDLLLSLAAFAVTARACRCPPSLAPAHAARRSNRLLCVAVFCSRPLTPRPSVVAGAQDEGKGGGGEGGTIFAFSGSILGDARRPLSAPCRAQRAVRSGRCEEKSSVCYLARLIVWLLVLCGWQGKKGGRKKPRERATCPYGHENEKKEKTKKEKVHHLN